MEVFLECRYLLYRLPALQHYPYSWKAESGSASSVHATTHSLWNIHHLQIRLIPQIIDLCPKERRAPSDLHKPQSLPPIAPAPPWRLASRRNGVEQYDLLGLVEVGHLT